jgi:hypothetical protein
LIAKEKTCYAKDGEGYCKNKLKVRVLKNGTTTFHVYCTKHRKIFREERSRREKKGSDIRCFAMGCPTLIRGEGLNEESVSYEGIYCPKCHRRMFAKGSFR